MLIDKTNYCAFMQVISKYDLLHILALGLNDLRRVSADGTADIIATLKTIVDHSKNFYHSHQNDILDLLEGRYNLSNTLDDIINKSNSALLTQLAQSFHHEIANTIIDPL